MTGHEHILVESQAGIYEAPVIKLEGDGQSEKRQTKGYMLAVPVT